MNLFRETIWTVPSEDQVTKVPPPSIPDTISPIPGYALFFGMQRLPKAASREAPPIVRPASRSSYNKYRPNTAFSGNEDESKTPSKRTASRQSSIEGESKKSGSSRTSSRPATGAKKLADLQTTPNHFPPAHSSSSLPTTPSSVPVPVPTPTSSTPVPSIPHPKKQTPQTFLLDSASPVPVTSPTKPLSRLSTPLRPLSRPATALSRSFDSQVSLGAMGVGDEGRTGLKSSSSMTHLPGIHQRHHSDPARAHVGSPNHPHTPSHHHTHIEDAQCSPSLSRGRLSQSMTSLHHNSASAPASSASSPSTIYPVTHRAPPTALSSCSSFSTSTCTSSCSCWSGRPSSAQRLPPSLAAEQRRKASGRPLSSYSSTASCSHHHNPPTQHLSLPGSSTSSPSALRPPSSYSDASGFSCSVCSSCALRPRTSASRPSTAHHRHLPPSTPLTSSSSFCDCGEEAEVQCECCLCSHHSCTCDAQSVISHPPSVHRPPSASAVSSSSRSSSILFFNADQGDANLVDIQARPATALSCTSYVDCLCPVCVGGGVDGAEANNDAYSEQVQSLLESLNRERQLRMDAERKLNRLVTAEK